MKYHRFIQVARSMRQKATPDLRSRLPQGTAEKPIRHSRRRITATAAAAAVIAAVLVGGGIHFFRTVPTAPTPDRPSAGDDPITDDKLHTVVRLASLGGQDAPMKLAVYAGAFTFNAGVGGTAIEHEACSCVVYSAADGTVFCPTHALKELLADTITGEIRVKHLCLPLGRILFTVGRDTYFYDLNTAKLRKANVDLSSTGTVMSGDLADFEKAYCILEGNGTDDHSAFYLVSMQDCTVEDLEKAGADGQKRTAHDIGQKISKGGRFAQYILGNDKGNTLERTNVLIDLATREVHTFAGEWLDSTPDDRYFVVMTDEGLAVYDTTARREAAFADSGCPAQYRYGVKWLKSYRNSFYADYALLDRLTGETIAIGGHPSAVTISYDGTAAYVFDRNKIVMDAYDFLSETWYTLPLSEDFAAMLGENAEREINFHLCANTDGSVTLTYYVTHLDRMTPEEQMAEEEKYPYSVWWPMLENDEVDSIASLRLLLEKFYRNGELTLYQGEGYVYLDASDFWRNDNVPVNLGNFVVEDYNTGWFYLLNMTGGHQYVIRSAKLGADAAQKTAALANDCHMPTAAAEMTFPYLKNGQVDDKALTEDRYTSSYILSDNVSYYLFPERSESGWLTSLDHPADIESLRGFLTYVDGLPFAASNLDNSYAKRFSEFYIVRISRSSNDHKDMELFDFIFGRNKNGSFEMLYLAQDGGHLASMTSEDYAAWKSWAEERIVRQNIPYEER